MSDSPTYEAVDTADLSPRIIHAQYFDSSFISKDNIPIPQKHVCDYEMVMILHCSGAVNIADGIEYIFKPGDIVFRKPGINYYGFLNQRNYSIRFDLKGNYSPDPPDYANTYNTYIKPQQNILVGNITDGFPYRFKTINTETYISIFEKIYQFFLSSTPTCHARIKSLILQLLCTLYDEIHISQSIPNNFQQTHKNAIIEAINYIQSNVLKNISLADIARNCGYCPNYFDNLFKEAMKTTPMEYLNNLKVEKCKEILLSYNGTIKEVSDICGFNSVSYFSYYFKHKTGLSPYAYRKSHIENGMNNLII